MAAHTTSPYATVPPAGSCHLQVVCVLEALVGGVLPPSPALVQLLLAQVQRWPHDTQWHAWLLPLLCATCCRSEPAAPPSAWAAVVQLCRAESPEAAQQVAELGVRTHPWCQRLWMLLLGLHQGGRAAQTQQQLVCGPAVGWLSY